MLRQKISQAWVFIWKYKHKIFRNQISKKYQEMNFEKHDSEDK